MKLRFKLWHLFAVITVAAVATIGTQRYLYEIKLNTPIEDLEISVRATNCLHYEGIDFLRQLIQRNGEDLMSIRNFGQTTLVEVELMLQKYDLHLSESAFDPEN